MRLPSMDLAIFILILRGRVPDTSRNGEKIGEKIAKGLKNPTIRTSLQVGYGVENLFGTNGVNDT